VFENVLISPIHFLFEGVCSVSLPFKARHLYNEDSNNNKGHFISLKNTKVKFYMEDKFSLTCQKFEH